MDANTKGPEDYDQHYRSRPLARAPNMRWPESRHDVGLLIVSDDEDEDDEEEK